MTADTRMLERFLQRDPAWDGRFVAGVTTTGIYCLASCPARRPRRENVRMFADERAARAAGLRPCRRCRPDRFFASGDPDLARYEALVAQLRASPGEFAQVADLAAAAELGATRLTEVFRRHGHTTPAAALQEARVGFAARRLLGGGDRLLDIALDAGFDSSSAFHDNFRALLCLTPKAYRDLARGVGFALALPADFRHADTLRQLGRDAAAPDQRVVGRACHKALWLDERPAVLTIELGKATARCRVDGKRRLSPAAMAEAHRTALRLLGLGVDTGAFERRMRRDPAQRRLVQQRPGLRVLQSGSPFDAFCWSVIGQQIHLALAFRCRTALFELAAPDAIGDLRPHPTPAAVAAVEPAALRARQFSGRKIEYLQDAANAIAADTLPLDDLARGSAVRAERTLLARRGVGPWSCNYVMMRGYGFADCAPIGDTGITSALQRWLALEERPDAAATVRLLEPFAPFRSLACWHLWRSLDRPDEEETA
ncbi:MAG: Ada metal-binding domain-containing protein [Planctomycetota bacterium]